MRLFIGLPLDRTTLTILEGVCARFHRITGVRWMDRHRMHLTLAFLDEQPRSRLEGITECVRRATEGIEPFSVIVEGLGAFPQRRNPRIIYAGVQQPNPPLATLHAQLTKALKERDLPVETRRFRPHITIGRVRTGKKKFQSLLDVWDATHFDPLENAVNRVVVYESQLTQKGARYTEVAEVRLG